MPDILQDLRQELKRNADEKTRESGMRFFKEKVKIYGVKTAVVSKIARDFFNGIKTKSKPEIFGLCEQLWKSGYMEESFVACNWSYAIRKQFEERDFEIFEDWVDKYVTNWASCDTFGNHTIGSFIEKFPGYIENLKEWTRSKNRWMRRAAAISLIVPARQGKFLDDILQIADNLLTDKDDMVQKGYGWLLKVASQTHQKTVFDYVMKHRTKMPRTALRYAIEKMPKELKVEAMAK